MITTFSNKGPATDWADEAAHLRMTESAVYLFNGIQGLRDGEPFWLVPPGEYTLIGVGRHVHTGQELVAYRCLENRKLFFCTLSDWALHFKEPVFPEVQVPEKGADHQERGSGF